MKTIEIETDAEAADIVCNLGLGSRELRRLASNAGVSRERGDTMRETAERIVAQDPALTARMVENDDEVDMDASAFRERREVGADRISLGEAFERARHGKMHGRLRQLERAMLGLPSYEASVEWELGGRMKESGYEPGISSVVISRSDDWDGSGLASYRAHAILRPTGRATLLSISSLAYERDYAETYASEPARAWRRFVSVVEDFYDPENMDG